MSRSLGFLSLNPKKTHGLFSHTFWLNFDLLTAARGIPDCIPRIDFPSNAEERWFWPGIGSWFTILFQLSISPQWTIIICCGGILYFWCEILDVLTWHNSSSFGCRDWDIDPTLLQENARMEIKYVLVFLRSVLLMNAQNFTGLKI